MRYINILLRSSIFILTFIILSSNSFATLKNESQGADVAACSSTGDFMASGGDCRTTPTKYEIAIFEMGLCTAHPFTDDGTKTDLVTMNKSTCAITFLATDQTNGSVVDIAGGIGGSIDLVGANTRPANGTYTYPYVILGKKFTLKTAKLASNGNTYYGVANSGSCIGSSMTTSAGSEVECDDLLTNFGGGDCKSGYVGATIPIGTLDAFLTNAGLERSHHTEYTNPVCDKNGKLVGIINLTAPFIITANTLKMQFNFIVTDYGINLEDTGSDKLPNRIGSAPFSGSFTITEAPQQ